MKRVFRERLPVAMVEMRRRICAIRRRVITYLVSVVNGEAGSPVRLVRLPNTVLPQL